MSNDNQLNQLPVNQESETFTAMCIWEDILRRRAEDTDYDWEVLSESLEGANGERLFWMQLAKPIDQLWMAASHLGYADCYDWEFIPAVLEQVLETLDPDDPEVPNETSLLLILGDIMDVGINEVREAIKACAEEE